MTKHRGKKSTKNTQRQSRFIEISALQKKKKNTLFAVVFTMEEVEEIPAQGTQSEDLSYIEGGHEVYQKVL